MLMLDLKGELLTPEERDWLPHPLVSGIILFTRNYRSISQLSDLIASVREITHHKTFLIAVDQEGGRVQRFKEAFTRLPPMRNLGHCYDTDPEKALLLAKTIGWLMASELVSVDIDLSFAPVLDLDSGISKVIGDRAFHSDPHVVSRLAHHFIQGMNEAGMSATGKHFPGHGGVFQDSHFELVVDMRSYDQLAHQDLIPFVQLAPQNLAAVMVAHVIYPECAPDPAGFSAFWCQEILRNQLGFTGVIVSDDIHMQGAMTRSLPVDRVKLAREAGCDMILSCNRPDLSVSLLKSLENQFSNLGSTRLSQLRSRKTIGHKTNAQPINERAALQNSQAWKTATEALATLFTPHE